MKTSEQLNELFSALSKAQENIKNAQKEGYNPMFKSNYTTITSVLDAIKTVYKENISIIQMPESDKLITRVGHSSGQWLEIETPLFIGEPKGMSKMQAYGNAITYARRYALVSLFAIGQEDNDGNECNYNEPMQKKETLKKTKSQNNYVQSHDVSKNESHINQKNLSKKERFVNAMNDLLAKDEKSYFALLGAAGYEKAEDVPEEKTKDFYINFLKSFNEAQAVLQNSLDF